MACFAKFAIDTNVGSVLAFSWKLSWFRTRSLLRWAMAFPVLPKIKQYPLLPTVIWSMSSESFVRVYPLRVHLWFYFHSRIWELRWYSPAFRRPLNHRAPLTNCSPDKALLNHSLSFTSNIRPSSVWQFPFISVIENSDILGLKAASFLNRISCLSRTHLYLLIRMLWKHSKQNSKKSWPLNLSDRQCLWPCPSNVFLPFQGLPFWHNGSYYSLCRYGDNNDCGKKNKKFLPIEKILSSETLFLITNSFFCGGVCNNQFFILHFFLLKIHFILCLINSLHQYYK